MHDFFSSSQFMFVAFLLSLGLIAGAATYLDHGVLRLQRNDEPSDTLKDGSTPESE
jgi:hypothetical protein